MLNFVTPVCARRVLHVIEKLLITLTAPERYPDSWRFKTQLQKKRSSAWPTIHSVRWVSILPGWEMVAGAFLCARQVPLTENCRRTRASAGSAQPHFRSHSILRCCEQSASTPLFTALEGRAEQQQASFHIPGHKVCDGLFFTLIHFTACSCYRSLCSVGVEQLRVPDES